MLCVTGSIDEYAVQQLTDFLKPELKAVVTTALQSLT